MATDQEIRDAGYYYIPPQEYLKNPFKIPVAPQPPVTDSGIVATNAFNNNDGNTFYTGPTSGLISGFQTAIDDRQKRLEELNRPLEEAQFPSFPGPKTTGGFDAQAMYNKASADLNDPFNRLATTQTFSGQMRPAKEVMDYADDFIDDYRMQYATGQLGPSYIPAEKPTLNRKISDAFYSLPFLSKPQSAKDIMESGYTGAGTGPGLLAAILGKFDRYSSLPRANQAFIAKKMGYTGPTVFGQDQSGLYKDPFGINTRSAFGDYAEYTVKRAAELDESIKKSKDRWTKKFGSLDAVNPKYGKTWAEMNKMNLDMQEFYNAGAKEFKDLQDEEYQDRIDKFVANYKRPGVKEMFEETYDGTNIHGGPTTTTTTTDTSTGDGTYIGGGASLEDAGGSYDGGYHGAEGGFENTGSNTGSNTGGGNPYGGGPGGIHSGYMYGGRVPYMMGGLASIL